MNPAFRLYALAFLGMHIAFMPVFVLLLPRRVASVLPAGGDATVALSWLLLLGGVVAGLAHIGAGAWSDRAFAIRGDRRRTLISGLLLLTLGYAVLSISRDLPMLALSVAILQVGINATFAPLGALLPDYFPDSDKGTMAGAMNAALPASGGATALIAWLFPTDGAAAFLATLALSLACILPLLVAWPFAQTVTPGHAVQSTPRAYGGAGAVTRDFALAWFARLLVQLGAAFLHGYLFLFLAARFAPGEGTSTSASEMVALVSAPATIIALCATVAAGWLSDRMARRRLPLGLAAAAIAVSLAALSSDISLVGFLLAYTVFQAGLGSFLSVDTALVAQLVSGHPYRGSLLGVMNLTNTLPAIAAPMLVLLAWSEADLVGRLQTIFLFGSAGALLAAGCVAAIRTVR